MGSPTQRSWIRDLARLGLVAGMLVVSWTVAPSRQLDAAPLADVLVVAHASVPVDTLTHAECSELFLKERKRWGDGTVVTPIDLSPSHPVREAFSLAIHDRSVAAIKRYWQRMLFSGRETPPVEKADEAALIALLRATPGAIGYVSDQIDTAGLKTLRVEP